MIEAFTSNWTLIHQGAESKIWKGKILNKNVIKKERFEKTYRVTSLDKRLTKERTRAEIRSLIKLKEQNDFFRQVLPTIYYVSEREIIFSEVENARTINEFSKVNSFSNSDWFYEKFGKSIAEIHKCGIIHGDITTSNFLINQNNDIVPIDFGLSSFNGTVEDMAVDLYVLERSLLTIDFDHYEGLEKILDAYKNQMGSKGKAVIRKLEEVRSRGRKRNMVG